MKWNWSDCPTDADLPPAPEPKIYGLTLPEWVLGALIALLVVDLVWWYHLLKDAMYYAYGWWW